MNRQKKSTNFAWAAIRLLIGRFAESSLLIGLKFPRKICRNFCRFQKNLSNKKTRTRCPGKHVRSSTPLFPATAEKTAALEYASPLPPLPSPMLPPARPGIRPGRIFPGRLKNALLLEPKFTTGTGTRSTSLLIISRWRG